MRSKLILLFSAALGSGAVAGVLAGFAGGGSVAQPYLTWTDPPQPAAPATSTRETLLATGHFRASPRAAGAAAEAAAEDLAARAPRALAVLSIGGAIRVVLSAASGEVVSAALGETIDGWRIAAASAAEAKVSLEREGETQTFDVIDRTKQ
ncbi:MAG: hypothetical protein U5J99_08200 [Parvularculaceae bacterium]|nr:hypothetical protein [Parvularculaceae bacterium]